MSTHISSWAWKNSNASGNALLVMLALADIANDEGVCWPGQKYLSKRTRLSLSTVRRAVRVLEDLGELDSKQRVGGSNLYQILTEKRGSGQFDTPSQIDMGDNSLDEQGGRSTVTDNTSLHVIDTVKAKKLKAGRIDPGFLVSDEMRAWAVAKTPAVDVVVETANFVDYWTAAAGASAVKVDWVAAWRTWMRNAQKWAVERGWRPDVREVARVEGDAVRDAWLAERGVTLEEYSERWDEPGWVASLESRLVGAR